MVYLLSDGSSMNSSLKEWLGVAQVDLAFLRGMTLYRSLRPLKAAAAIFLFYYRHSLSDESGLFPKVSTYTPPPLMLKKDDLQYRKSFTIRLCSELSLIRSDTMTESSANLIMWCPV